jgi:predicted MPP superfamily phosphohydrolase
MLFSYSVSSLTKSAAGPGTVSIGNEMRGIFMSEANQLKIAAVSDIHYTKTSKGALQELFTEASKTADVLVICGDFTDFGLP